MTLSDLWSKSQSGYICNVPLFRLHLSVQLDCSYVDFTILEIDYYPGGFDCKKPFMWESIVLSLLYVLWVVKHCGRVRYVSLFANSYKPLISQNYGSTWNNHSHYPSILQFNSPSINRRLQEHPHIVLCMGGSKQCHIMYFLN